MHSTTPPASKHSSCVSWNTPRTFWKFCTLSWNTSAFPKRPPALALRNVRQPADLPLRWNWALTLPSLTPSFAAAQPLPLPDMPATERRFAASASPRGPTWGDASSACSSMPRLSSLPRARRACMDAAGDASSLPRSGMPSPPASGGSSFVSPSSSSMSRSSSLGSYLARRARVCLPGARRGGGGLGSRRARRAAAGTHRFEALAVRLFPEPLLSFGAFFRRLFRDAAAAAGMVAPGGSPAGLQCRRSPNPAAQRPRARGQGVSLLR